MSELIELIAADVFMCELRRCLWPSSGFVLPIGNFITSHITNMHVNGSVDVDIRHYPISGTVSVGCAVAVFYGEIGKSDYSYYEFNIFEPLFLELLAANALVVANSIRRSFFPNSSRWLPEDYPLPEPLV